MRKKSFSMCLARGLIAGAAGTAALTLSTTIERRIRGRGSGGEPARGIEKVLGIVPANEKSRKRMAMYTHWAYGIAWGGIRGLIAGLGLKGRNAALTHFLSVWGTQLAVLPALHIIGPPWRKPGKDVGIDAAHHALYAAAAGAAFGLMGGCRK